MDSYGFLLLFFVVCGVNSLKDCNITTLNGTSTYLDIIFTKYGSHGNKSEYITTANFDQLMKSLYLGSVNVDCQPGDKNCLSNSKKKHGVLHLNSTKRLRRDVSQTAHKKEQEDHKLHWQGHLIKCLKPKKLLKDHGIGETKITKDDFVRLCPSIVEQIDDKVCVHTHVKEIDHASSHLPTTSQVWGYGMLSITIISLLSLSVIGMIPCLKKSFYHKLMAYLVALAVGTLSGDAMLHLIPHAFAEGVNNAIGLEVSKEEQLKQHYSQVWRALFVLLGIYIFFLVEQLMKIRAMCTGQSHGHSHGASKDGHAHLPYKESPTIERKEMSPISDTGSTVPFNGNDKTVLDEAQPEASDQVELMQPGKQLQHVSNRNDNGEEGHNHADDRQHHHHHGEKEITKDTKIASVAWMVVVGDGFHNFSDGLAVGAAFSASMSSGLSTAIAVFFHELPHELGDFAILINSGMTYKQAIVYNLVSAILAYFGLAVGIFIGESETGRHFILSITAGLFLYVSLADMLPELTHQEVPSQSQCSTFICQHLGILSGIGIMLLISLFEHIM